MCIYIHVIGEESQWYKLLQMVTLADVDVCLRQQSHI